MRLSLLLLGPFQASLDGQPLSGFDTVKTRALLAYLADTPGRLFSRSALAGLLWPERPEEAALSNLRHVIANLRQVVQDQEADPPYLTFERNSLSLRLTSECTIDTVEYESLLNAAVTKGGMGETDLNLLERAVALYRGDFLEGMSAKDSPALEEWILARRDHYRTRLLDSLYALAQGYLEVGSFEQAKVFARRQIEIEPWREEAYRQLMTALAEEGRGSEALAVYAACSQSLNAELDAGPSAATRRLSEAIQRGETILHVRRVEPLPRRRHNLPHDLTSFIGREKQLEGLHALLAEGKVHLVTLTGPGGSGKTRLALKAAEGLLEEYKDGVYLVELAALSDPNLVVKTLMAVLELREMPGRPPQEALLAYLEHKHLLLVLDNCEHLLAECSRLADLLLKACAGLVILATSREILGVGGEDARRVPPLELPDVHHLPELKSLGQVEAVELFVERARKAFPGFTLDAGNAAAVAQICQRLDGIPLAIELAAARLRMMTIHQVAARRDNVFLLLTGGSRSALPRQQTLKATMDWSYALLSAQERLAFHRLSVFTGGWMLEAAEAVCSVDGIQIVDVLDLLGGLVDKSLVAVGGEERYTMLEIVRQYAHEKLLESGEGSKIRELHLAYYLQLGEIFGKEVRGKGQIAWLDRMERELSNLRLALEWSHARNFLEGLRLASAMAWFWGLRAHHAEGVSWVEKLLAVEAESRGGQSLAVGVQSNDYLLVWVRAVCAVALLGGFSPLERKAKMEESIALCRQMGDRASWELAWALSVTYDAIIWSSLSEVVHYLEESLAISREKGYAFLLARCLWNLSMTYLDNTYWQIAAPYLEESLAIFRQLEDPNGIAASLRNSSAIASYQGDYAHAFALDGEAQAYYRQVGNLTSLYDLYLWQLYPAFEIGQISRIIPQADIALAYFRDKAYQGGLCFSLMRLSEIEWARRNFEKAQTLAQEAVALSVQANLSIHAVFGYCMLFRIAFFQDNLDDAHRFLTQASSWLTATNRSYTYIETLSDWVMLLFARGKMVQAVKVWAAIDKVYQQIALWVIRPKRERYAATQAELREVLGEEAFAQAWKEGHPLTMQQALDLARQE